MSKEHTVFLAPTHARDTLMSCGYGRTTFPGGNTLAMRDSLQKLFSFPAHLTIYPGHGEDENLGIALRNIFG